MVVFISYLMSHSLGYRDTCRVSADPIDEEAQGSQVMPPANQGPAPVELKPGISPSLTPQSQPNCRWVTPKNIVTSVPGCTRYLDRGGQEAYTTAKLPAEWDRVLPT